ncbi:unnamed protein product [Allacma fusca]|uniref:Uncharacterized protein n=1 Tax=Allacma fusca TaxID=39272 RepID=A0A8J2JU36_9HEXA|nr:unnamed protein product [Allacma fusca]
MGGIRTKPKLCGNGESLFWENIQCICMRKGEAFSPTPVIHWTEGRPNYWKQLTSTSNNLEPNQIALHSHY